MKRFLLIACALILAACSDEKPEPVPQPQTQAASPVVGASGAVAPAAAGPVIVNNLQPAAPAQDNSTQNMLLGGMLGYMLGSSGNRMAAAQPVESTRIVERHYVRERAALAPVARPVTPTPTPAPAAAAAPAPVPAAVKPAGPLPQVVPAPAPAAKPFAYGAAPAPTPKVTYGAGFSKPSAPAPAPRPSVSYNSRPGSYSRR